MRNITELVSEGFIWGVGITRPKPGCERLAALYITGTLVGAVAVAVGAFFLIASQLFR